MEVSLPRFAIYPLLKRVTHWPQAWLGFAMNFGFISAWIAKVGDINIALLCVMTLGCWWYVSLLHFGV